MENSTIIIVEAQKIVTMVIVFVIFWVGVAVGMVISALRK